MRTELYKAVKYQVNEYGADHGMNLAEMWDTVNGRTEQDGYFWEQECLHDYRAWQEQKEFDQYVEEHGFPYCDDLPFN